MASTRWPGGAREPSAAEIAETLRSRADYRLSPPVTGPLSGLTDVLVHGADIRIPLGLAHRPEPQQVAWVLDFLTSPRQFGFFPQRRPARSRHCSTRTRAERGVRAGSSPARASR